MAEIQYSNARYLASKRTVDDRALNKDVVERLRTELALVDGRAPRILEIGAGLGTMIARLVDWRVVARAEWWLLDVDAEVLAASRQWVVEWARAKGYRATSAGADIRIVAEAPAIDVTVRTIVAELGDFLAMVPAPASAPPRADVVIANAFLDLVDVPSLLPRLLALTTANGLFWFSINYDGETIFEPAHAADGAILEIYNRSMDERSRFGRPAGHSQTGRRLFGQLASAGGRVLAAGASDWVVHPDAGRYPADEAYFLHHIVATIADELALHPELDARAVAEWVALRHAQITSGALVFQAHQLDLVGRAG